MMPGRYPCIWWSDGGSNPGPSACHADALPAELSPRSANPTLAAARIGSVRIDLNADVGESYRAWTIGEDEALIPLITSANVACGAHAGDPLVMAPTGLLAKRRGVAGGAPPGA